MYLESPVKAISSINITPLRKGKCIPVASYFSDGYVFHLLRNGNVKTNMTRVFKYAHLFGRRCHDSIAIVNAYYELNLITMGDLKQHEYALRKEVEERERKSNSSQFIWLADRLGIKLTKSQLKKVNK